ncbi:methyltransferase [Arthrobacter yangruifuii]|uniref:Methyltransferase n=1 Tax=Arthrobacter yangruifuii TaxID=2606616 RepID=A0A5N6MSJ2_9MICC|nr:methyltransferase [Arthrobacter yangruifuii]KAD4060155.1 methyltransferase [Arthrobacter yangruifuii]
MSDFSFVPDAPRSRDIRLLQALAADLEDAGYTVDGVAAFLGEDASAALQRDQLVPALLVCRAEAEAAAPRRVAVPVQLWLLGETMERSHLDEALPRTGTDGLLELGLIERGPVFGTFQAAVDLRPYGTDDGGTGSEKNPAGDLWVASDLGSHQRPGVLRRDHVLGIGQASLSLAQLTVRTPVGRALDLGTGCGIQTFHLLRHTDHVTATDISARALGFARFNLMLNAPQLDIDPEQPQERFTLRLGSLLEPVAGEEFDLVVSNPPFVITPRTGTDAEAERFTYRDGGLAGDGIVAALAAGLEGVLRPGGTAQMLGNWEIPAGREEDWSERLEQWLPDGTDAWVIQRETLTPPEYAEMWLRDAAQGRERTEYAEAYAGYLADFASRNVGSVGFGSMWLRRRPTPAARPLRRFEEITHPVEQPLGPHLEAAVRRFDWVSSRTHLADEHLRVADDVTEERHQRPGAEHPGVILLRQGAGLRRTNLMSTELTGFVSACDGELSVGQIVSALAALLDRPDSGFGENLISEVRNLVLDGFLIPDRW